MHKKLAKRASRTNAVSGQVETASGRMTLRPPGRLTKYDDISAKQTRINLRMYNSVRANLVKKPDVQTIVSTRGKGLED